MFRVPKAVHVQQQTPNLGGQDKRRCAKCSQSIRHEAVLALNRLWHPEHFDCAQCKQPIKQAYQEQAGQAYCVQCYSDKFNPKCAACEKVVRDACVQAMDKHWHTSCFVCSTCKQAFPGGEYYLVDDKPYDLDCHWEKRLEKQSSK